MCINRFPFGTFVWAWLAVSSAQGITLLSEQGLPEAEFGSRFSSNWYAEVRWVLKDHKELPEPLDFATATNTLSLETRRGNVEAKALWGIALIVLNPSSETADAGLQMLREAADAGNVSAMLNLGYMYETGRYLPKDYSLAFRWFSLAADKGDAEGELQTGGCYHYGLGTTQDFSLAAKYYRYAAEQTNYVAMKSLGYLLMNGYGVEKDNEQAKKWLLRAANEGGNRRAMYDLGVLYAQSYPDTDAMVQTFWWTKKSADLGDALAADELANFYYRGWGVTETNLDQYRHWLFKAASLGSTDAEFFAGQACRAGNGVHKDADQSLMWYWKAADKNHPEALYDLAVHYHEDRANPASAKLSSELMVRAARMGHREAQLQCAYIYFRGDLGQDCAAGKDWLLQAATNGWPRAEFLLFQLYFRGASPMPGCAIWPKDTVEALKWLRLAARHGHFQAESTLAVMLIQGEDVEKDPVQAEKLLRDAAGHGYAQAENDLGFALLHDDILSTDPLEAAMWCKLAVSSSSDPVFLGRASQNLANAMSRLTFDQQQQVADKVAKFKALPAPSMDPKVDHWERHQDYQAEDGSFGH